jgi:hypothetical protein
MESYLEKPQTIGLLLDNAVWLVRKYLISLFPLTLLYAVLLFSPSILLTYTPIQLTEILHQHQIPYLILNFYFSLIIAGAILYRLFALANGKTVSNGEAFSSSLRKSIYSTLTIAIIMACMGGCYWLIDKSFNYSIRISVNLPNFGEQSLNLFGILFDSFILTYLAPSFGLVITKNYGPIKAIFSSFRLVYGNLNRTLTVLCMGKIIYLALAISAFIFLFALSTLIALDQKIFLYHLILQTIVASLASGFLFSVYSMLLIDLDIRYHTKKYFKS